MSNLIIYNTEPDECSYQVTLSIWHNMESYEIDDVAGCIGLEATAPTISGYGEDYGYRDNQQVTVGSTEEADRIVDRFYDLRDQYLSGEDTDAFGEIESEDDDLFIEVRGFYPEDTE